MNMPRAVLAALVAVWCFDMKADDAVVFRLATSIGGKPFEFVLSASRLAKTPSWPDNQENPPLSPRKALAAARKYLARLVADAAKWQIEQLTLRSVGTPDKWIYVIEFSPPLPPGGLDGKSVTSKLVVLMDGTALEAQPLLRQ